MADKIDKKVIPVEEIMLSDPPSETQEKRNALINDLNQLSSQIDNKAAEFTPQFVNEANRNQL